MYIDPGHDHTLKIRPRPQRYGTWIYTRRMTGMVGNNTATLMSTTAQPTTNTPMCLTFWYHMFGRDPANFSLLLNTLPTPNEGPVKLIWVKRRPISNNWVMAQVNIPPQMNLYYLMFRASLVANSRDNIGLDDISYTNGTCAQNSFCDFEVSPFRPPSKFHISTR